MGACTALRSLVVQILTGKRNGTEALSTENNRVTGSAGKTTTKDAIFVFFDGRFVRKSEKSYNSELGVPSPSSASRAAGLPWRWFVNVVLGAWVVVGHRGIYVGLSQYG